MSALQTFCFIGGCSANDLQPDLQPTTGAAITLGVCREALLQK
jgi:hypothetical protein